MSAGQLILHTAIEDHLENGQNRMKQVNKFTRFGSSCMQKVVPQRSIPGRMIDFMEILSNFVEADARFGD